MGRRKEINKKKRGGKREKKERNKRNKINK